jgi:hypothetical protein
MTGLLEFTPLNPVEDMIVSARKGDVGRDALVEALGASDLFVSSRQEVLADGSGFEPLLLGEASAPLVAAFTAPERPAIHRSRAEYMVQMKGDDLLARMPPGYGVVVNPGYVDQLIISAGAIEDLRKQPRK